MVARQRLHAKLTQPFDHFVRTGTIANKISEAPDLIDTPRSLKYGFKSCEVGVHVRDDQDGQTGSPRVSPQVAGSTAIMRAGPSRAQRWRLLVL